MKKFLHLRFLCALVMMVCGASQNMMAQAVTYDFTNCTLSEDKGTLTFSDKETLTVYGSSANDTKTLNGYFKLGKSGSYITFNAFSFDVSKIVVVGNSGASASVVQNIYVGETAVSTAITGSTGTNTFVIDENYRAAGNVYQFKITSAHSAQITKIQIYKAGKEYPVEWLVDGQPAKGSPSKLVADKEKVTDLPQTPTSADFDGKKLFVGWSASEVKDGSCPTDLFSTAEDSPAITKNTTFHAVFASLSGGYIDELTADFTGVTSTSYTNWNKIAVSGAGYAGYSARHTSGSIQMRSSNSNSGVVITKSCGLPVKKITVNWYSSTNNEGKTLDIYGNNSAYSQASDLYYTDKQGTKLGSLKYTSSTSFETELTITDETDYNYIGIRSNNNALYLMSVAITYGNPTYSAYATSVEPFKLSVSDAGYATFCPSMNVEVPAGVKVFAVTENPADNKVKLAEVSATTIKAGEGVILGNKGNYDFNKTYDGVSAIEGNKLVGVTTKTELAADAGYILSADDNNNVFFALCSAGTLEANKAYLPNTSGGNAPMIIVFDDPTAIKAVENSAPCTLRSAQKYNLAGQQVGEAFKGIVIVNGKKVIK